MGKLKSKGIAINCASLGIIVNQFKLYVFCFVYHLDVMRVKSFKLRHCFEFNEVTKHTLTGIKLQHV